MDKKTKDDTDWQITEFQMDMLEHIDDVLYKHFGKTMEDSLQPVTRHHPMKAQGEISIYLWDWIKRHGFNKPTNRLQENLQKKGR